MFGFSDHSPMPFPSWYESTFRMSMSQLEDYVDTVLSLRDEYKDDIEIHLGLETEYYPDYFDALIDILKDYPIEYMLLGQHMLDSEIGAVGSGGPTDDVALLRKYIDQCITGLSTGHFLYLAHPDLMCFMGPDDVYEAEMSRLCGFCIERAIPVEINLLGLKEGRAYPSERFWKLAGRLGCTAVLGMDCHHVENVYRPELIAQGEAFAARCGVTLTEAHL